jgi:hypothetical protein
VLRFRHHHRLTGRQLTLALIGALLLAVPPLVWAVSSPATTVGIVPPPVASGDGVDDAVTAPPPSPPPTETSWSTTPLSTAASPAIAAPTSIRIDAIGVDHRIVPVGLEADGTMEIPADVQEIGWYEPGVRPGEAGSAVLAGHVDSRTQGRGAFFELGSLDLDDEIVVTAADGSEQRWRVTARTRYPKDELPIDDLFVWGGDEQRLVLITCGGDFDRTSRNYSDNVVVHASPA